MQQFKTKKTKKKNKSGLRKQKETQIFRALGHPFVLLSGHLSHDCNRTACSICATFAQTYFTDSGCNDDPCLFFLLHIKDI